MVTSMVKCVTQQTLVIIKLYQKGEFIITTSQESRKEQAPDLA